MSKSTKIIAALGIVAGIGAAALPLTSYAADPASTSANAKLNVNVGDSIALKVVGTDTTDSTSSNYFPAQEQISQAYGITQIDGPATSSVDMTANQLTTTLKHTATVYTNAPKYNLNLAPAAEANVNLVSTTSNIPALAAAGKLKAGTAAWGYVVNNSSIDANTEFTPVVAGGANIVTGGTSSADPGSDTVVTYGVATGQTQAQGTYSTTLKFTATTSN